MDFFFFINNRFILTLLAGIVFITGKREDLNKAIVYLTEGTVEE